jgi:alpha-amylase
MRFTPLALLITPVLLAACNTSKDAAVKTPDAVPVIPTAGTTQVAHPEWSKNSVIYEVNIRQYTPQGTFAAFAKELPRIRELGVDILWIMPVQPIGKLNRKGSLGSYYSIADYTAFNPEFGTEADFKAMLKSAHDLGFKVILDWVANHTAFDHKWTVAHKDWYTLRKDGTISRAIDPEGKETDWGDVADLNYSSAPMRAAMISDMKWWVDSVGVDGFRCDVAGFVPNDFWAEARAALIAAKPDLFLLAEWEDPALHASFDATYGWGLFHEMNDVASGKKKPATLDKYFEDVESKFPVGAYRMNFTSNHDENSWNGTEFERMGVNHLAAYVLSTTVQNAFPLLYSGQEASFNRRLAFFEKDSIDWKGPSLAEFYTSMFALHHTQQVLWNGQYGAPQEKLVLTGSDAVYGFVRARDTKAVVVVTNFGATPVTARFSNLKHTGSYADWFSRASVALADTGSIEIPAHGYRVLVK